MFQSLLWWGFKLYVIDCVLEKSMNLIKNHLYNQVFEKRILDELNNSIHSTIIAPRK